MHTFLSSNRRAFFSRLSTLGVGAALSSLTDIPLAVQRALASGAIGRPGANGRIPKLLFIFLKGANDGLNTVIPLGDPAYAPPYRSLLRIPEDPLNPHTALGGALFPESGSTTGVFNYPYALPMGNGFAGLHPSLKFLAPVYNSGSLALIHRVGYPMQSRSHFDSQAYWQTGSPNTQLREGLLYRAMIESGLARSAPLTGVSIASTLPLILRGSGAAMANVTDPLRLSLLSIPTGATGLAKLNGAIAAEDAAAFPSKNDRELLALQYGNLGQVLDIFSQINFTEAGNTYRDDIATDGDTDWASANNGGYYLFPTTDAKNGGWQRASGNRTDKFVVPQSSYPYFTSLKAASIVLNKTDAVVAGVLLDGFDTHSGQVDIATTGGVRGPHTGAHANLLRYVGWSMYALQKYFKNYADRCHWDDLVVVTLSEFGRTTVENSNRGTDHAEASVMFAAGGAVKGYVPSPTGAPLRTGVFNCGGAGDTVIPWQGGASGSMFQAAGRYLRRNTDYRSVLGRIIRDHLGATQDQLNRIIPNYSAAAESLLAHGVQKADGVPVAGEPDIIA
jgi:uncharacterized protein (DUF1501 family)